MKKLLHISSLVSATLFPKVAFAHGGGDHVHGVLAGLEHPLLGLDHLLAMVAVGVIAACIGGRGALLVPLSFVSAMVAGALAGMAGMALPSLEMGIALSSVAFGAVIALARPLPLPAVMALTSLFGLFHGNAHGLEIPGTASGFAYAAGFVASTSMLHGIGALSALGLGRWTVAIRVAGLLTSSIGLGLAMQAV